MRIVAGLVLMLSLAACQTTAWEGNENSPYYTVPAGTPLTLHREVVVPADRVDVYLQDGRVRAYAEVNPYHPFCSLEVRRRLDTPQTVAPGEFRVVKTVQEIIQTMRVPGVRLASGGSPSFEIYNTVLELRSDRQPQVAHLACAHWVYPPQQRHLTVNEMRRALGELMTLRLPGKGD